jgi:2-C-methyl-D-erythritol 4-phosphate cytidylyltransferase
MRHAKLRFYGDRPFIAGGGSSAAEPLCFWPRVAQDFMPDDPSSNVRFFALVPAAGSGSRFGSSLAKQYVAICGRPMLSHTLAALAAVDRLLLVLVALAPGDAEFAKSIVVPVNGRFVAAHCGGLTRAATVAAGLAELARLGARSEDWVLVHDAARCLVRAEGVDALIDACLDDAVGGLLAVRAADTLKREVRGRVAETLSRSGVWQAQTPQMFRLGTLAEALARAGSDATDEASAVEGLGLAPLLVPGSAENLKITLSGDLALAEAILTARQA